jgi:hypothetical protein
MEKLTVYLDTCIISGIARMDLTDEEIDALLNILEESKKGNLNIITSKISKSELDVIPIAYRKQHELIYYLLGDLPYINNFKIVKQGGMAIGIGMGPAFGHHVAKTDPIFSKLNALLPDRNDAMHIFQAAKNQIQYFLTADYKTILKFKTEIQNICNLKARSPTELIKEIIEIKTQKAQQAVQS